MAKYDIPRVRKGDTWDGILFTITVNAVALNLTDASIRMDLRLSPTGIMIKRFSTLITGITILTPNTDGKFTLDQWDVDVDAGNYYYDIEITLANPTEIKTWIWGNWVVAQDVTYG